MELHEIDVYIDPDGKVRVEVRGVKGQACLDITQALQQALGGQVEAQELTPEFYEQDQSVQDQQWLGHGGGSSRPW